jgi:hypothetical protein
VPKAPVQIGNIYESRDKREEGRRMRVESELPGEPGRWLCIQVFEGRANRNRKIETKLSTKNLQSKWKLVSTQATDTLQELLTRLESVHPDDIASSLRPLRSAWLEAGCPGLKRQS